jgi:hypothetical protein
MVCFLRLFTEATRQPRRPGHHRDAPVRQGTALHDLTYTSFVTADATTSAGCSSTIYAALAKVLPGDIDEAAARSLRALGSATCWLWQLLADELFQDMFLLHVCRMNGILVAGFVLLPCDIKTVVLGRLDSAKDLARVEC